ncbi:hypothetical protein [Aliagarivorans taiwanensis]|uniref:hypothetical protein n=1 Tax=Aliagarivorans taiwanensis TaxID=561966 RepID=UPI00047CB698|nr:hypothetical protein [Aliagarivorans taiwanensis]
MAHVTNNDEIATAVLECLADRQHIVPQGIEYSIGSGSYGEAFDTSAGLVAKITRAPHEICCAARLLAKRLGRAQPFPVTPNLIDIVAVCVVGELGVIVQERLTTPEDVDDPVLVDAQAMLDTLSIPVPEIIHIDTDDKHEVQVAFGSSHPLDDDELKVFEQLQAAVLAVSHAGLAATDFHGDNLGVRYVGDSEELCFFDLMSVEHNCFLERSLGSGGTMRDVVSDWLTEEEQASMFFLNDFERALVAAGGYDLLEELSDQINTDVRQPDFQTTQGLEHLMTSVAEPLAQLPYSAMPLDFALSLASSHWFSRQLNGVPAAPVVLVDDAHGQALRYGIRIGTRVFDHEQMVSDRDWAEHCDYPAARVVELPQLPSLRLDCLADMPAVCYCEGKLTLDEPEVGVEQVTAPITSPTHGDTLACT